MAIKSGHDLAGLAVLTLAGGERIGRVEDVIFHSMTGRMTGFLISVGGMFSKARFLPMSEVNSLGSDALTVTRSEALCEPPKTPEPPIEFSIKSLAGRPVVNESGTALGTVADALVDTESLTVMALSLATGVISDALHGKPHLPLSLITTIGPHSVIVANSYDPKSTENHA